jgi:hypothetical protein
MSWLKDRNMNTTCWMLAAPGNRETRLPGGVLRWTVRAEGHPAEQHRWWWTMTALETALRRAG